MHATSADRAHSTAHLKCLDTHALRELLHSKTEHMRKMDAKRMDVEKSDAMALIKRVEAHMTHLIDHGASASDHLSVVKLSLVANPAQTELLTSFERVQLATLMPTTADEALALIPGLDRFNPEDVARLVHEL